MAHVHHHDHGEAEPVTSEATQRALVGVIVLLAAVAVVGLVLLWPDAERPVLADELGLGAELVDATVTDVTEIPCFGTEEDQGIRCNEITFDVTSGTPSGETGVFEIPVTEVMVDVDDGDDITVGFQEEVEEERFRFYFNDFQRDVPLGVLIAIFAIAVIALGRWQGLRALIGLVITGVVMVAFLFPSVLDGHDPTAVALVSAVVIAITALYLTHGVNERTTVALLGTFGALAVTAVLAAVFSAWAHFTGFGSQDAIYLNIASAAVDIKGLVLAGIIIGSLGVLDDVTVTQVSAVWQLHQANPTYGARRLYRAGVEIGRDHIASTVNTLVLAYAGASLPLLLVFTQAGRRLTDVGAGELVAVEVVRTLVGSVGLVTAVPLTTLLAALVITRGAAGATDDAREPSAWSRWVTARRRPTTTGDQPPPAPSPPPPTRAAEGTVAPPARTDAPPPPPASAREGSTTPDAPPGAVDDEPSEADWERFAPPPDHEAW